MRDFTRRSALIAGAGATAALAAPLWAKGDGRSVAVVGAGVFGAWTAEQLRRAGHKVTAASTPWARPTAAPRRAGNRG